DPRSLHGEVGFINVGKKTGRRGKLTLYSLVQPDAAPEKLTETDIVGAGTNFFPDHYAGASFDPHLTEKAPFMLACAVYFDDSGASFEQAFLFERGKATTTNPTTILHYTELAAPDRWRPPLAFFLPAGVNRAGGGRVTH